MNRIDQMFQSLGAERRAALIPFLTAGDPDLGTTLDLMRVAADGGADLLEIGVPFSDPTSDGPILQRSAEFALRAGTSLPRVLELIADFRQMSQVPIVLYGYYNPIFRYGPERFARAAQQVGIDGVLTVDLPPEEAGELLPWLRRADIHFVFLLTPTSGPDRVKKVRQHASGFVYYVSVTGVTGVRPMQPDDVRPVIERLRRTIDLPIGVGFGISTPEQVAAVAQFADAAVVGSAIMRLVDAQRGSPHLVAEISAFIRRLRNGLPPHRAAHAAAAPVV